ncbi:hypothetical protein I317_00983 [Kwoniella heveanensis CBS 569]|nr:hypothetical protein I317_00983 [Kwoniella heveanensis CBS 569]
MSSSLEEYDAILREAEEQFGNGNGNGSGNGIVDSEDQDRDRDYNRTHLQQHQGDSSIDNGHIVQNAAPAAHLSQDEGMMDDEQDDTDFVIMDEHHQDPSLSHGQEPLPDSHDQPEHGHDHSQDLIATTLQTDIFPETSFDLPIQSSHDDHNHGSASGSGGFIPDTAATSISAVGGSGEAGGPEQRGTNWTDKKERQKAQNRKAAEKSRSKKRGQQMALEIKVANMQDENAQLRARLAELQASRQSAGADESASAQVTTSTPGPGPSGSPTSHTHAIPAVTPSAALDPALSSAELDLAAPSEAGPSRSSVPHRTISLPAESRTYSGNGIDYAYITKLQVELTNAKTVLLERSVELSKLGMQGLNAEGDQHQHQDQDQAGDLDMEQHRNDVHAFFASNEEEVEGVRKEILTSSGKLTALKAEEGSLKTLIKLLKGEIESLRRQRGRVSEILEQRKRQDSGEKEDQPADVESELAEGGVTDQGLPEVNEAGPSTRAPNPIDTLGDDQSAAAERNRTGAGAGAGSEAAPRGNTAHADTHAHEHVEGEPPQGPNPSVDNEDLQRALEQAHTQAQEQEQADGLAEDAAARAGNMDKALLDIGGWIDAAVKNWDQDRINSNDGKEADDPDEMVR